MSFSSNNNLSGNNNTHSSGGFLGLGRFFGGGGKASTAASVHDVEDSTGGVANNISRNLSSTWDAVSSNENGSVTGLNLRDKARGLVSDAKDKLTPGNEKSGDKLIEGNVDASNIYPTAGAATATWTQILSPNPTQKDAPFLPDADALGFGVEGKSFGVDHPNSLNYSPREREFRPHNQQFFNEHDPSTGAYYDPNGPSPNGKAWAGINKQYHDQLVHKFHPNAFGQATQDDVLSNEGKRIITTGPYAGHSYLPSESGPQDPADLTAYRYSACKNQLASYEQCVNNSAYMFDRCQPSWNNFVKCQEEYKI